MVPLYALYLPFISLFRVNPGGRMPGCIPGKLEGERKFLAVSK